MLTQIGEENVDTYRQISKRVELLSDRTRNRMYSLSFSIFFVPLDPWDSEFIYLSPGLHGDFDLISYGNDGEPGGEEDNVDINNWELD